MIKNRIIPTVGISVLIPLWVWAQTPTAPPDPAAAGAAATPPATPPLSPSPAAATPANPAEKAAPKPPTEAELVLDDAARKVAALATVSAKLEQQVKMLNQIFTIEGTYLKAPGGRIFLELVVKGLPGAAGKMLQVCDGVTIWDFQQLLEQRYYRKATLGPILEKLKSPEIDASAREQVLTRLGIEGPDVLLTGLRRAIYFDQKEEGTLDGRPVWILRGTWQDRQGLLGPNQQPLPARAPLPAYVPSQATLWLGKDDGWPYKVRLAGRKPTVLFDTRRIGPDGRPVGPRSAIQSIEPSEVELVYTIVSLNPAFKGDEFAYKPPEGVRVDDSTEAVVNELDQMIQMKIAQQKAETARTEPLLEKAIDVPRPATRPDGPASPTPPPLAPRPK
jgi:hypothetical protein